MVTAAKTKTELVEEQNRLKLDLQELEKGLNLDALDADTAVKMVNMRTAYDTIAEQLLAIKTAEALVRREENNQIAQENALGGTEMATDLAGYLMDTLDGNLYNLGNSEIPLPFAEFYDEILAQKAPMMDNVLLRPNTSNVPNFPRNRANQIGYVDVEFDKPTSILDMIPKQETDDSKITYNEFLASAVAGTTGNNADGVTLITHVAAQKVNEGDAVKVANYTLVPKTVNMVEYGLHAAVTNQAARDVTRLRGEIRSALRADIRQAMDKVIYDALEGATDKTEITEVAKDGILPQLIEVVNKAADDTYTNTQRYFMLGSDWSELKQEANALTQAYDTKPFFDGRMKEIDGMPLTTSPVVKTKRPFGGNFERRFMELFIRNNPMLSLGTVDDDFLKRQSRVMIQMEAVVAIKLGKVIGMFKNDPTNTDGWFKDAASS